MRTRLAPILLLVVGVACCSFSWAGAEGAYQGGMEAFKAQRYELALRYFLEAERVGARSSALHYNLGTVNFKLGRYSVARRRYEYLTHDPEWRALAQYNLGLIDDVTGDVDRAQSHYRSAFGLATHSKLKRLAALKIVDQASIAEVNSVDEGWAGIASTGAGFDDNVVLADDQSLASISDEGDYFAEALAVANTYVSGGFEKGWRLELSGYYRAHKGLDEFDFGSASLGAMYNKLLGRWHLQTGAITGAQFAGHRLHATTATHRMQLYRFLRVANLRLRNDFSYVLGGSSYEYLDGWQNRLTGELSRRIGTARLRLGYELEVNDRDNLALAGEFFSYSPTRHKLFAGIEQRLGRFKVLLRADLRASRNSDEDIEINPDGTITQQQREENRSAAKARIGYQLGKLWRVFAQYQYTDNDSNFDRRRYQNIRYMLGLESAF